jgi:tetratricopeptide (TPR) repeat protein
LPIVAESDLIAFGKAVTRARSLRGWTLAELGGAISPPMTKFFLSRIENGRRQISPVTVGKIINALELAETWIDRFLDADVAAEDEETPKDREADRLIRIVEKDETAPTTAEPLLLLLAEEWAGRGFTDPTTAYTTLRGALQAAFDLKAQGTMPSNSSDQLQAVLRRVSELNDAGQMDEADAALQAASDRNAAEAEALFEAKLKQDRLRNRPSDAAERMIKQLRNSASPDGLFGAIRRLMFDTRQRGDRMGDMYDLALALELAKANHQSSNRSRILANLSDLGLCHLALGEREATDGHLVNAERCFRTILGAGKININPSFWASTQVNLGIVLQTLGDRRADSAALTAATNAYGDALDFWTRDRDPEHWAGITKNLANSQAILSMQNRSAIVVGRAIDAYEQVITVWTMERSPHMWAETTSMLGNAFSIRGELLSSKADLSRAIVCFNNALEIFTRQETPHYWSRTQNNLGLAHCSLGMLSKDFSQLDVAQACFKQCLLDSTLGVAPYHWAETQWNLARLAFYRFELTGDASYLPGARTHALAARAVFAESSNKLTASIDQLLALVDAS